MNAFYFRLEVHIIKTYVFGCHREEEDAMYLQKVGQPSSLSFTVS